ncbi:MAG: protein kinase [Armatimonadetes bacterium]|nr:protein kinase [Armatimonadota bacterium]
MIPTNVGDYRIVELISDKGGFGVVYKAVHQLLEQEVAIKALKPRFTADAEFKERFFTEAKTQARLKHPNIVSLLNFLEHAGEYYLVVEYMEGVELPDGSRATTLADTLVRGPLPEDKLAAIFRQVLDGVGFAHQQGVIHRDIKPLNVLFTAQGSAKVTDFGIAKMVGGETSVSVTGDRVGTPAYMSPEQVLNRPLDIRSDIYSLGVTLYEMASGGLPFKSTPTTSIDEQHIYADPPSLRGKSPQVSSALERVITKAMAKKPEERYQTCEEFAAAIAGGGLASTRRSTVVEPVTADAAPEPVPEISHATRLFARVGAFVAGAIGALAVCVLVYVGGLKLGFWSSSPLLSRLGVQLHGADTALAVTAKGTMPVTNGAAAETLSDRASYMSGAPRISSGTLSNNTNSPAQPRSETTAAAAAREQAKALQREARSVERARRRDSLSRTSSGRYTRVSSGDASSNRMQLRAILEDAASSRTALIGERRLKAGDTIEGHRIVSVSGDGIRVAYGGSTYTVHVGEKVNTESRASLPGLPKLWDFWATWCPPCKQLKPTIEAIEKDYEGKVEVKSIDVDLNKELSQKFNVQAIPTLVFLDTEGKELSRIVGLVPRESIVGRFRAHGFVQ